MNHSEAVQQMATERYLLDEMSPEARDAFEEHFFDCPECAMDLRAAAAFVDEAKVQLPELTSPSSVPSGTRAPQSPVSLEKKQSRFSSRFSNFWRPAFAAPVFATLLAIIGYQNLVTYPALRSEANEPILSSTVFLHSGTRSINPADVNVDQKHGVALLVDTPQQQGYALFLFELRDPQGKTVFSIATPKDSQSADGTLSLAIPGAGLHDGAYTLAISGVSSNGAPTEIERHTLDLHLKN